MRVCEVNQEPLQSDKGQAVVVVVVVGGSQKLKNVVLQPIPTAESSQAAVPHSGSPFFCIQGNWSQTARRPGQLCSSAQDTASQFRQARSGPAGGRGTPALGGWPDPTRYRHSSRQWDSGTLQPFLGNKMLSQ